MTLNSTAMRRTELCRLKVTDIDSQRMMIRVTQGKGSRDREVPLSPALAFVTFINLINHLSTLNSFLEAPSDSFAVECFPFRAGSFRLSPTSLSIGWLI